MAPESTSAWLHFPACMETEGQSVIWATVMVFSLGSPLRVGEAGEGPFSLNHPQSHYLDHLSCSIWMVDRQL